MRPVQQRLCRAFGAGLRRAFFLCAPDRGQQQRHHVFQIARVAPEQAEHLGKHLPLFGARDETGMQRPVEIGALGKARGLDGADRLDHLAGADGQAGFAQGAGEMGDVGGQLAVFGQVEGCEVSHGGYA